MNPVTTQVLRYALCVYSFAALLVVAGLILRWQERSHARRNHHSASRPVAHTNAGPHRPVSLAQRQE
jgi:hypothetical protein